MHYLPLIGIAIVVIGFVLRFNPLLVVTVAALATGLAAGFDLVAVVAALGKAFNDNRYVSMIWIVLPVIGLLERHGLQQRARTLIAGLKNATAGRLLLGYLVIRQITAALGLTSVAGHAQTVRPLVAPMAEAAAEQQIGDLDQVTREKVKSYAAATDNVGLFFGEDIFIAIASILLIKGTFETYGIELAPLQLSVWAIPTAIIAFLIHGTRLLLLDRKLRVSSSGCVERSRDTSAPISTSLDFARDERRGSGE
ncbi:DUF969 domain-containing protein [Sphingomonas cavernae]|uniref:DUF969 domain-containing protein n=1 Tax=Sphingomonas cavernae TaxID=2320861 RepID=A0A418WJH2_9SPHN|nr:DUF969 domain-containing protein [Sphingomonas cavernae]RJF90197.1 DUF969 domain-containing protein [Sphingomonas cavernae]